MVVMLLRMMKSTTQNHNMTQLSLIQFKKKSLVTEINLPFPMSRMVGD